MRKETPFIVLLVFLGVFVFGLAGEAVADVSAQLNQAETFKNNGQYDQAEAIYQQIVTAFPNTNDALEAQKQLTLVYIATDRQQEADAALKKLLAGFSRHNNIAEAVWQIAHRYKQSKKYEKALQLHQYNVDHFSGDMYAMWSQVEIVKSYIGSGDFAAADAAFDKLLAVFSQQPTLPKEVYQIADAYDRARRYNKAGQLYRYVIDNWPKTEHAIWAATNLVRSYLALGDEAAAEAACNKLLASFSNSPLITKAVYDVAQQYRRTRKYGKALQFHQYNVDHFSHDMYAMWSQAEIIKSYIGRGNYAAADAASDRLLAVFLGQSTLPKEIYQIANAFSKAGRYDKANQLYRHIVDNWPDSEQAISAQRYVALSSINIGDDKSAQDALNKLLINFAEDQGLAEQVVKVADGFREAKKYDQARQLYQHVIDNWPQSSQALSAQTGLVWSNMALGNEPNTEAAVDKLLTEFSRDPNAAKPISDIADSYREAKKYQNACKLYERIVENWPKTEQAIWAQAGLIKSYQDVGETKSAEAAVDKLLANFTDNPLITRVVWDTARYYRGSNKYEKGLQLHQYNVEHFPKDMYAMWSQVEVVKSYISNGNEPAADAAFDKLLAVFSQQPTLPKEVYRIADAYGQTGRYDKANELYQKAGQLYQYVINKWPKTEHAMWAKAGIAKLNIILGNEAAAEATVNELITDFNDYPDLLQTIFLVGEQYYNKALQQETEERDAEAKENFRKAVVVWERIIKELPPSADTAEAYVFLAECYRRLREYKIAIKYYNTIIDNWPDYKYVWHAQFLVGDTYERLLKSGAITESEALPKIREAYERVVRNYPDKPATMAARSWLQYYARPNKGEER